MDRVSHGDRRVHVFRGFTVEWRYRPHGFGDFDTRRRQMCFPPRERDASCRFVARRRVCCDCGLMSSEDHSDRAGRLMSGWTGCTFGLPIDVLRRWPIRLLVRWPRDVQLSTVREYARRCRILRRIRAGRSHDDSAAIAEGSGRRRAHCAILERPFPNDGVRMLTWIWRSSRSGATPIAPACRAGERHVERGHIAWGWRTVPQRASICRETIERGAERWRHGPALSRMASIASSFCVARCEA